MKMIIWCLLLALTLPAVNTSPRQPANGNDFMQVSYKLLLNGSQSTQSADIYVNQQVADRTYSEVIYGIFTIQTEAFHNLCFNITDNKIDDVGLTLTLTKCNASKYIEINVILIFFIAPSVNIFSTIRYDIVPITQTSNFVADTTHSVLLNSLYTDPVNVTGLNLQVMLFLNGLKVTPTTNQSKPYFFKLPDDAKIVNNQSIEFTIKNCEWLHIQIISVTIVLYQPRVAFQKTRFNDYRQVVFHNQYVQTLAIHTTHNVSILLTPYTQYYAMYFSGFSANQYNASLFYEPSEEYDGASFFLIVNQGKGSSIQMQTLTTQIFLIQAYSCPSNQSFYDNSTSQCEIFCPYGYTQTPSKMCTKCDPLFCSTCNSNDSCEVCNGTIAGLVLINGSCDCDIVNFNLAADVKSCEEKCGDGKRFILPCDDGNIDSGDGCSSSCQIENGFYCIHNVNNKSVCTQICGDGLRFVLTCDDNNTVDGDGCSSTCMIEPGWNCSNTSSKSNCTQVCGDGVRFYLACDDNNTINGDGCSSICEIQANWTCSDDANKKSICTQIKQICGDGIRVNHPCDDNNTVNGDGCSSTCQIETGWNCSDVNNMSVCTQICGDGVRFTLPCDDGNKYNYDGCSDTCQIETGYNCSDDTNNKSVCAQICGDGLTFVLECDDNNTVDGDGCSSVCSGQIGWNCSFTNAKSICVQLCGDGLRFVLPCDDNNTDDGDGCSKFCQVQANWTCLNDGNKTSICTQMKQICGDGIRETLPCDDGNTNNGDGCSSTCQIETGYNCSDDVSKKSVCTQICGDGLRIYIQCDDNNTADGDGCSSTCTIEPGWDCSNTSSPSTCTQVCGDGVRYTLPCDDNNTISGDGCSSTCQIETGYNCSDANNKSVCVQICGDGLRIYLQCDDNNTINGDGCSSTCHIENGWDCSNTSSQSICNQICGDGVIYVVECDDNNTKNGDGCSSTCTIEPGWDCLSTSSPSICAQTCGDGVRFTLPCDDGNRINGDGCSDTCQIETGYNCSDDLSKTSVCAQICGDGLIFVVECDDNNTANGDGCSSTCFKQNGWTCSIQNNKSVCQQVCGDGLRFVLACDDNNTVDGDGCSSTCTIEPGWNCSNTSSKSICTQVCGDGVRYVLECDDNNTDNGDGCSSTCKKQNGWTCHDLNKMSICDQICGDGLSFVTSCDDNNTKNGDGCSSNCLIQAGWVCWPSIATDPTSKSNCTKKSNIILKSYNKNPLANELWLNFEGNIINWKRRLLQTLDGSNYFNTSFPFTRMELFIPAENEVQLNIFYDQSLNGNTPLTVTYLSTSFSNSPTPQPLTLPNVTQNNLALKVYPPEHYDAVEIFNRLTPPFTYVGLFVLLASYLFVSKLLALESLFVLQFAYGGLVMLIKLEALMYPYRYLWIFNGYNYINEGSSPPDGRYSAVYYKTDFMDNFNIDFIIFFLFIVVGSVMLLINRYKPHRQLHIWGKNFICEWQMSGMLFCAQQLIFAYVLCMYYGERTGEGVAIGSVLLALYCAYAVWFARTRERGRSPFGDYRRFFKTYDQNFYSYVMIYRLLISLVMVVQSQTIVSLSVLLALNIGWFALLMVRRPYIKQAQLPPIINSLTLIALNIFYLVIRNNSNDLFLDFSTYVPIAVLIIMGSILLFNTGYSAVRTVRYFRAKELAKKLAQEITTQGNQKTEFSFETGEVGSEIQNQTIPSQLISENSEGNREESLTMGIEHITPINKIARMNNDNTEQIHENQNSNDLEEFDHSEIIRDRIKQTPATELRDKPAQ